MHIQWEIKIFYLLMQETGTKGKQSNSIQREAHLLIDSLTDCPSSIETWNTNK